MTNRYRITMYPPQSEPTLYPESWETTWDEFADANVDDAETLADVATVEVGGSVMLGGGACPLMRVERIA